MKREKSELHTIRELNGCAWCSVLVAADQEIRRVLAASFLDFCPKCEWVANNLLSNGKIIGTIEDKHSKARRIAAI